MKVDTFNTIPEAINDIMNGKMVIVVDDEDRENEGDIIMAAHFVTSDAINFMINHARGLVCLPVTDDILNRFDLQDMVTKNTESMKTAFTVSIDGAKHHGVSTGISAADRAKTIQLFINPNSSQEDIVTPGHIFPLRARNMGVLRRAGHTEAAVDLARLAGLPPAGVICEIIKENGDMARVPDLFEFAKKHNLKMITIQALIQYRIEQESFIEFIEKIKLPTPFGKFDLHLFKDTLNDKSHIALTLGDLKKEKTVLTRVHAEYIVGDVFGSLKNNTRDILHKAMKKIQSHGSGVLIYIRKDNTINPLEIAQKKKVSLEEQLREYGIGAQILRHLGVSDIDLMTQTHKKIVGLEGFGLTIHSEVSYDE